MADNFANISTSQQDAIHETVSESNSMNDDSSNIDYNSKINLNIRGERFTITRDDLMGLPESILLCLFPNGVFLDANGQVITNLTEKDIVHVNFDPKTFQYIIDTFEEAQQDSQEMGNLSPQVSPHLGRENVLQTKPSIIVLREDLDYYVVPPSPGLSQEQMRSLKIYAGEKILDNKLVFNGLGYDPDSSSRMDLGPAESHLFDMLTSSGFDHREIWGSRTPEPSKAVIQSLSLVRLKNHSESPPDSPSLDPIHSNTSNHSRRSRFANFANSASRAASRSLSRARKSANANQTKLLLFWRKPARKCWWSDEVCSLNAGSEVLGKSGADIDVRVHIRRVWTLELSIIGVQ